MLDLKSMKVEREQLELVSSLPQQNGIGPTVGVGGGPAMVAPGTASSLLGHSLVMVAPQPTHVTGVVSSSGNSSPLTNGNHHSSPSSTNNGNGVSLPLPLADNNNGNGGGGGGSGRLSPNSESAANKLFVGGLSWQTSVEKLREYFGMFGTVTDVLIMKDPVSQRSRGFGFITFSDPSCVDRVLQVPSHSLDGKRIDPKHATPKHKGKAALAASNRTRKIFVGGVSQDTSVDEVKAYFGQFGKVEEAVMLMDQQTKRHRGFGFITFESEDVVDHICEIHFHNVKGKRVECKKAQPKDSVPQLAGVPQGTPTVYQTLLGRKAVLLTSTGQAVPISALPGGAAGTGGIPGSHQLSPGTVQFMHHPGAGGTLTATVPHPYHQVTMQAAPQMTPSVVVSHAQMVQGSANPIFAAAMQAQLLQHHSAVASASPGTAPSSFGKILSSAPLHHQGSTAALHHHYPATALANYRYSPYSLPAGSGSSLSTHNPGVALTNPTSTTCTTPTAVAHMGTAQIIHPQGLVSAAGAANQAQMTAGQAQAQVGAQTAAAPNPYQGYSITGIDMSGLQGVDWNAMYASGQLGMFV